MKKTFDDYYTLYTNGNEELYELLNIDAIRELEKECEKDLKFYEFQCWLESMEEYYYDDIEKSLSPEDL